ncbi:MTH938/NDUFAF3 family protein [Glycomyces sp. NRRL B-16210]|uniref:MTH938/NDUFAF3 family protein n=1 Tax=Glycomyces sp. NRRL B-16210 TaxID=1463821 RepID=UPI0004BFCDEE|nr:MTH938/NDUFAF3 family protein [Glycomyces sp. NRRL B-16210]
MSEATPEGVQSPMILSIEWGRMEIARLGVGKDFMLYPGGGKPWDWRESGTEHDPGIQPSDVQYLIDRGAELIVLSLGMERRLRIDPATIELLERLDIPYRAAETSEAVALYNESIPSVQVGGLFHSTC